MQVNYVNQNYTLVVYRIMSENLLTEVFIVRVFLSASMELFDTNT